MTTDWPPRVRLIPEGDSVPIDDIDVTLALKELFEVFTHQRDWLRRELPGALSRGELNPVQQKWAGRVLGIKRSMTATTPDSDTKYAAWLNRYSAKDKRLRARKKFADRWADFAKDFGPLSDELDSKTFGSRASDLSTMVQEATGLRAEVDDPELRHYGDVKVAQAPRGGFQSHGRPREERKGQSRSILGSRVCDRAQSRLWGALSHMREPEV